MITAMRSCPLLSHCWYPDCPQDCAGRGIGREIAEALILTIRPGGALARELPREVREYLLAQGLVTLSGDRYRASPLASERKGRSADITRNPEKT
jgi:hypothetical protein